MQLRDCMESKSRVTSTETEDSSMSSRHFQGCIWKYLCTKVDGATSNQRNKVRLSQSSHRQRFGEERYVQEMSKGDSNDLSSSLVFHQYVRSNQTQMDIARVKAYTYSTTTETLPEMREQEQSSPRSGHFILHKNSCASQATFTADTSPPLTLWSVWKRLRRCFVAPRSLSSISEVQRPLTAALLEYGAILCQFPRSRSRWPEVTSGWSQNSIPNADWPITQLFSDTTEKNLLSRWWREHSRYQVLSSIAKQKKLGRAMLEPCGGKSPLFNKKCLIPNVKEPKVKVLSEWIKSQDDQIPIDKASEYLQRLLTRRGRVSLCILEYMIAHKYDLKLTCIIWPCRGLLSSWAPSTHVSPCTQHNWALGETGEAIWLSPCKDLYWWSGPVAHCRINKCTADCNKYGFHKHFNNCQPHTRTLIWLPGSKIRTMKCFLL